MAARVIIAGGGTGGHIFPAIAIANAIKKIQPETEILFIGAKGKMEMEKVPQAGYRIVGLDIVGFNRSSLIKNIGLPFKLAKSFFQVKRIFKDFKPDAAIGVGGYSSFPVLRYAQLRNIATFIHEANSFGGKSNILLSKKATKVFVATDGMEKFFPKEKIIITGNPVRQNIVESKISREEGIKFFNLDPNRKTVLSVGGSLGAKNINEALDAGLDEFESHNIQLIWQTGKPYSEKARQRAKGKKNIWVNDFINEMPFAYAAADVVVSRSGAMTIAELCVVQRPVLFVPFPFAAEDHQTVNAMKLVLKGAAMIIRDAEVKEKLIPELMKLVKDDAKQKELRTNIGELAIVDADVRVASEVLKIIG